jgi:hypothetical protein
MRFVIHDVVRAEAVAALARKEHQGRPLQELLAGADAPAEAAADLAVLLAWLDQGQWQLLTTDAALVRAVYERKIPYRGVIVFLIEDADDPQDQGQAVERLFERYRRLTPGRLYTVTPNRVKIRQLPGAGQRNP